MFCHVFLCNVLYYCDMTCSFGMQRYEMYFCVMCCCVMYVWCDGMLCDVLLCDEFLMWCNVLSRILVQCIVMMFSCVMLLCHVVLM